MRAAANFWRRLFVACGNLVCSKFNLKISPLC